MAKQHCRPNKCCPNYNRPKRQNRKQRHHRTNQHPSICLTPIQAPSTTIILLPSDARTCKVYHKSVACIQFYENQLKKHLETHLVLKYFEKIKKTWMHAQTKKRSENPGMAWVQARDFVVECWIRNSKDLRNRNG